MDIIIRLYSSIFEYTTVLPDKVLDILRLGLSWPGYIIIIITLIRPLKVQKFEV